MRTYILRSLIFLAWPVLAFGFTFGVFLLPRLSLCAQTFGPLCVSVHFITVGLQWWVGGQVLLEEDVDMGHFSGPAALASAATGIGSGSGNERPMVSQPKARPLKRANKMQGAASSAEGKQSAVQVQ